MKESSLHYMINTRQNHPSYAVHDERGGIPSTKDICDYGKFFFFFFFFFFSFGSSLIKCPKGYMVDIL